jgi:hypothetical protein
MSLARHAHVLWRFRAITAAGLLLGVVLAVLASYRLTLNGGVSLQARGTSSYSSASQLLVTQPGFPEGRVVLPTGPPPDAETEPDPAAAAGAVPEQSAAPAAGESAASNSASGTGGTPAPKSAKAAAASAAPSVSAADPTQVRRTKPESPAIEFADPGRFMVLADLYTQLITSDEVRARIPERPAASRIAASPLPATSGPNLPIISLTTTGATAHGAHTLNVHTVRALRGLLADEQSKNRITASERVELSTLKAPSRGTLVAGPSHTASVLALLLCIIGTVAVTHLLSALRERDIAFPDDAIPAGGSGPPR